MSCRRRSRGGAPPDHWRAPAHGLEPVLDADGLLRHAGRWVTIPDAQLPVVALLIANRDRIVPTELVARAHAEAGGSTTTSALEGLVARMRLRVTSVGLTLHTIRQRGLLLEVPPPTSLQPYAEPGSLAWST